MFGTSGIRGEFGTDVTTQLALDVGRAIASEGYERAVIGRDPRKTSPLLADALSAGLRECGADVAHLGELSTPTLARSVGWYDADIGVGVTASHNPPMDNGLKLWGPDGSALVGDEQDRIADRVESQAFDPQLWNEIGERRAFDTARERHVSAIESAVTVDPSLHVVLDVGNGCGGLTATALRRLGCEVTVLDGTPDGSFPSRPSEPTAENCELLRQVVRASDAEMGVAHDGDADRMHAVTESGRFVPGDVLLALFARREALFGSSVAVPIDASMIVRDELEKVGAGVTYTRVGDGHVAGRTDKEDVVFGGEPSGAWIWPSLTRCPDGPLAAAKLASIVATDGSLDALVDDIPQVPIQRETVETERKEAVVDHVADTVSIDDGNVTAIDGVRVDVDGGWYLVRASGTEPVVRITAEARDRSQMQTLLESAQSLVEEGVESTEAERQAAN